MENTNYQQIELFLSGRQLKDLDVFSKSDPFVLVQIKSNNRWANIGRTETINNNLNPNFTKTFLIDYVFEMVQPIRFEVRDDDGSDSELIGQVETTVGNLFGARNQISILELGKKCGKLIVRCDKVQQGNEFIMMKWSAQKLMNTDGWFGTSDPFLRIFKQRDDQTYLQVYETEVVMNNLNPLWKMFEIMQVKLATSNDKNIKIECWDWEKSGKHQFIGEVITNLADLQQYHEYILKNPKHKNPGKLKLDQCNKMIRPSFQDYITGGLQLNLIVSVDYTGSNGNPNQQSSLHFRNPNYPNQYQTAINAVGEILLSYDYDKMIPCYGFGAQLHFPTMQSNGVSHCFPLSGDPNKVEAFELAGIMNLYSYALNNVSFSGPTYFGPLIEETMRAVRQQFQVNQDTYSILLIMTDGIIHDMEKTKQLIVDSARLPYSIIIIGVGNEDFSMMEELDGDQGLFSGNRKAERDLVQFVPFRNFGGQTAALARHVLAEIPEQIVKYNLLIGKQPNPPKFVDINQMGFTSINQQQQINQQPPQQGNYQIPQQQQQQQQYPQFQSTLPQQQQFIPQQQYQQYPQQFQSTQNYQQYPPNGQNLPSSQYQPTRGSEQINPQSIQYQNIQQSSRQSCNVQGIQMNQTAGYNHQYPQMQQSQQQQPYPNQQFAQNPQGQMPNNFQNVKNPME